MSPQFFQVQLIISKSILPWFGGSAAVWTTNLLVFQVLLLGGYVYSHLVSEWLASHLLGGGHSAELREQGGDLIGRSGECFLNGWGESDSRGDLFGLNANYKQPVR